MYQIPLIVTQTLTLQCFCISRQKSSTFNLKSSKFFIKIKLWKCYCLKIVVQGWRNSKIFITNFEDFKLNFKNNHLWTMSVWIKIRLYEVNFRSPVYKQRELTCENHWLKQLCFSRAWLLAVFLFFKCIHSFRIMKSSGIQLPSLF